MELFYSEDISCGRVRLDADESAHCIRVLRHRVGDEISVIDGRGTLLRCVLEIADAKGVEARIEKETPGFGAHPYHLTMAVCPTKNLDRYEWFVEKATEIGVDVIAPVIGDRSERRVLKTDRLHRLALSAAKQSLKAAVPQIEQVCSVRDFIASAPADALKLICYCFDDVERVSITTALQSEAAAAANLRFAHPSQPVGWAPPVHETTGGHGCQGQPAPRRSKRAFIIQRPDVSPVGFEGLQGAEVGRGGGQDDVAGIDENARADIDALLRRSRDLHVRHRHAITPGDHLAQLGNALRRPVLERLGAIALKHLRTDAADVVDGEGRRVRIAPRKRINRREIHLLEDLADGRAHERPDVVGKESIVSHQPDRSDKHR